jgi:hypothetical protein
MLATWGLFMLLAAIGLPEPLRDAFAALGLVCLGSAAVIAQGLRAARTQLMWERRFLELEERLVEIAQRLDR